MSTKEQIQSRIARDIQTVVGDAIDDAGDSLEKSIAHGLDALVALDPERAARVASAYSRPDAGGTDFPALPAESYETHVAYIREFIGSKGDRYWTAITRQSRHVRLIRTRNRDGVEFEVICRPEDLLRIAGLLIATHKAIEEHGDSGSTFLDYD